MNIQLIKKNNIQIKPLNKKKIIPRTIQEPLPDPIFNEPFIFILSAKIGSGKSTTLSNILRIYQNYFLKVFFCSSNIEIDESGEKKIKDLAYRDQFNFNQDRMHDSFDDSILKKILEDIKETKKDPDYDENEDHFLIVVDDLSQSFLNLKSLIVKTILKTRHLKLSWIITTQRFRNICPPIRNQCSYFITFLTQNDKEIESMSEMLDLNAHDFKTLLNETCNEQYRFIFVDSSKNPPHYYSMFDKEIIFNNTDFKQPEKIKKQRKKKEYSDNDAQTDL